MTTQRKPRVEKGVVHLLNGFSIVRDIPLLQRKKLCHYILDCTLTCAGGAQKSEDFTFFDKKGYVVYSVFLFSNPFRRRDIKLCIAFCISV